MAKKRDLTISAINITVQPPNPQNYVDLWQKLFQLKRPIKQRGDQMLLLGKIENVTKGKPLEGFKGAIYRFTHIDTSKPWFDLDKGEEADKNTVKKQITIPPHLCPNLAVFQYVFYPKAHRLIFESKSYTGSLSSGSVEKFISTLLAQKEIAKDYPNSEATMEQDKDNIEEILDRKILRRLIITVKKPNPDGPDPKVTKAVFDEMEREGLQQKTLDLKAAKHGSVKPNKETRDFAQVASSNGSLDAIGSDEKGKPKKLSSKDKPAASTSSYSPSQTTLVDYFLNVAGQLAKTLSGDNNYS